MFATAANLFLFLLTPALLVILVEPTNLYAYQQVRDEDLCAETYLPPFQNAARTGWTPVTK